MASFGNTVTIRRPVADVFAFLADFENVPAWTTRSWTPGRWPPGRWGGDDLPAGPFGAQAERRGLRGDGL
jgi:uncharacterized protein YndB with AHSA1/START domain